MEPLVSIIMPAYNAERYIAEAIESVLTQTHTNWELLIVDDGSTDGTRAIIDRFTDERIRVFSQPNSGIGGARNNALEHARGAFMCGLDSDDVLPPESVSSRLAVFSSHPGADMVDGTVVFMDGDLKNVIRTYVPTFTGEPFAELVALTGACFMGFSWLVRWHPEMSIRFVEHMSHGEDLCFYLAYSPGRVYRYTDHTVLVYRRTGSTTMTNLDGLARSYARIFLWLADRRIASKAQLRAFRKKTRSIMVRSFLKAGQPMLAIQTFFDRGAFAVPRHRALH